MIFHFSIFYFLIALKERKNKPMLARISPRVAPRGPLSIARPVDRRAKCSHVAITGRDRRDATGKARTPITRRRLAIGCSGDGVSRRLQLRGAGQRVAVDFQDRKSVV